MKPLLIRITGSALGFRQHGAGITEALKSHGFVVRHAQDVPARIAEEGATPGQWAYTDYEQRLYAIPGGEALAANGVIPEYTAKHGVPNDPPSWGMCLFEVDCGPAGRGARRWSYESVIDGDWETPRLAILDPAGFERREIAKRVEEWGGLTWTAVERDSAVTTPCEIHVNHFRSMHVGDSWQEAVAAAVARCCQ